MPLYDYLCKGCDHEWEKNVGMNDIDTPINEPCPECNVAGKVVKIITRSNPVDPLVTNAGSMVDPVLRNKLDQMSNLYPGMKRDLG